MEIAKPQRTRQLWLTVHRYAGLAILAFLAVAALTGCMLSFEHPLDRWLNPALFAPRTRGHMDPLAAVATLERRMPALVATDFPVRAVAGRNIVVAVASRTARPLAYDEVFLDGGDGHPVAMRRTAAGADRPHWIRSVYLLHTNLLAGTPGRWLLAVVALAWLLSNLVGVYLTLPLRRPYWAQWRRSWTIRFSGPLPRLLLDLHRASALWLIAPLTVLAFTSVALNFFDEAFMPVVRQLSPPRHTPFDEPAPALPGRRMIGFADVLPQARRLAAVRAPGWQPAVYQAAPNRNLLGIRFTRSGIEDYRALGPVTYWFDGTTGRFVDEDSPYRDSAGQKLTRALFPLHTGQMIGWPGIALDVVLGLATLEMCGTGIYLWLKRRRLRVAARRQRRRPPIKAAPR